MGVEKLLPFDCLNINELGAMHMNIHSDAQGYSLECPYINRSYCLIILMKKKYHIVSARDINSLSNSLVLLAFNYEKNDLTRQIAMFHYTQ